MRHQQIAKSKEVELTEIFPQRGQLLRPAIPGTMCSNYALYVR